MNAEVFESVATEIRRNPDRSPDAASVAALLNVSRKQADALFREHGHLAIPEFLERNRVDSIAAAIRSGADHELQGEEAFVARYGMTPAEYASLRKAKQFALRLPEGYRFREVLAFYGRDAESLSEQATATGVRKCIRVGGKPAELDIRFTTNSAICSCDAPDAFAVHDIAIRMMGLHTDSATFEARFRRDRLLGQVIQRQQGLTIPMAPDPWEALAWAICGQQITVKAAVTLRRGLIRAAGDPHRSGLIAHPTAQAVARMTHADLLALKFSRSKAEYMLAAARAVASGEVPLDAMSKSSAVTAAARLRAIRGIGAWTVQYTFLRGIGFGDCLPASDVGLARGFEQLLGHRPTSSEIERLMKPYAPYRSLATYHVWASLSLSA